MLDIVALPASPTANALEVNDIGSSGSTPKLFAKAGLMIRDGATFSIRVAPEYADRAQIGWGSPGPTAAPITVKSCQGPSASPSGWLAFPGGYYVDQPACLPVIIESAGRTQRLSIGVGMSCPGQQLASALTDPTSPAG